MDLRQGDCLSVLRDLPAESVDLVLCDLPYGVTARNDWDVQIPMDPMFAEIERVAKRNAAVLLFGQGRFTAELICGPWKQFYRYSLVWKKNKPRGFLNANKMPLRYHEDIVVFYREIPAYNPQMIETGRPSHACTRRSTGSNYGDLSSGGVYTRAGATTRYPGSVLEFPVASASEGNLHPTQKPVALLEFLLRSYSNAGAVVLDFCMGSGTTGVAVRNVGQERRFIGIEKSPAFFQTAVQRITECLPTEPRVAVVQDEVSVDDSATLVTGQQTRVTSRKRRRAPDANESRDDHATDAVAPRLAKVDGHATGRLHPSNNREQEGLSVCAGPTFVLSNLQTFTEAAKIAAAEEECLFETVSKLLQSGCFQDRYEISGK